MPDIFSSNIALIGMPAVGKSTVGVLLAKYLAMTFVDTDLLIQTHCQKKLKEIISSIGVDEFRRIEEKVILSLNGTNQLIATGGSVVYSEKAMTYLRGNSIVVFLDISIQNLKKRLNDLDSRGVIRSPGQTIEMLFAERVPLYRRHADISIICDCLLPHQVVASVIDQINSHIGFEVTDDNL
ncbi:MAG: shikimate kinase [Desulfobacteraceae bacterium]|jgi:shikimate kinase